MCSESAVSDAVHDEQLAWHCTTEVRKFDGDSTDDADLLETVVIDGNAVAAAGVSALWEFALGNGTTTGAQPLTYINGTNAYIGVGDSTTANATPCVFTDLQASTNKARVVMDATYPQHSPGTTATAMTITFRATFSTATANFAWNEWGIFNGTTGGSMFNRAVVALGTKTSTATWQLTVTITIS